MKRTAVIGASPNPARYSYEATKRLNAYGETVFPIGIRSGKIGTLEILTDRPALEDIHTITLYVGAQHQSEWTSYILSLQPKRVIFNPGTENPEFEELLLQQGIEAERSCTLVLLSLNQYHSA